MQNAARSTRSICQSLSLALTLPLSLSLSFALAHSLCIFLVNSGNPITSRDASAKCKGRHDDDDDDGDVACSLVRVQWHDADCRQAVRQDTCQMYRVLVGDIFTGCHIIYSVLGGLYLQGICVFHIYMVYACFIFTGYQSWSYYVQCVSVCFIFTGYHHVSYSSQGISVCHMIYRVLVWFIFTGYMYVGFIFTGYNCLSYLQGISVFHIIYRV